jgi:glycosyltransferase involved in cell wall biosynthesis
LKVLIITQYFWPENFRINELARSLVARGIKIDVLTGKPNYPGGFIFPGYKAVDIFVECWEGMNLFRVPIFPRGFKSRIRLFFNYLSFIFSATFFGAFLLRKTKPDIIFVYAPSPLLQTLPALFIGWIKRIPVVLYVQDLWPESLYATGIIKNRIAIYLVKFIVKIIYRKSSLILVSSRPFISSIERFSPTAQIIYFPNSVDSTFKDFDAITKSNVPELETGFNIVFAGNIGEAQAVHVIIETADILKKYKDIRFIILGYGSKIEWMKLQKSNRSLDNIILAGSFPMQSMPNILSRSQVLLVTLADRDIFASTVPNKIQAYMAVGRPIIASMNGEGARIVRESGAGLAVNAEDSEELAAAILKLYSMSENELKIFGSNAYKYFQKHFNHELLMDDLILHLSSAKKEKK